MTTAMRQALLVLTKDPDEERYGLEIAEAAGLGEGTIYQLLLRLEAIKWLQCRPEEVDPRQAGRPRRNYYKLTPAGYRNAMAALARTPNPAPWLAQHGADLAGGECR